ncbi:MAG: hypothetical protein KJO91_04480 [Gammaproteobacteria bacterium]|nr:hypothetical protein [Gammaproteobacteria bacterium]
MGIRLLFLLLALAAIWMIVRYYWNTSRLPKEKPTEKLKADDMVSCHKCGLHIPVDEAVKSGNQWYCCQEHADSDHDD